VTDPDARRHVRNLLNTAFAPEIKAWDLQPNGDWVRSNGHAHIDLQELLMKRLADRSE
jgi:polyphosphate kinase